MPVPQEDPEKVGDVEGVAERHREGVALPVDEEEVEGEGVKLDEALAVAETLALSDTESVCVRLGTMVCETHVVEEALAEAHWEAVTDTVRLAVGHIDWVGVRDPVGQLERDGVSVEEGVELPEIESVGDTESEDVEQNEGDGEVVGETVVEPVPQREADTLGEVLGDTVEQPDAEVE